MSRAHLEIRRVDGRVFIIDRQSKNGVAIRPAGQTQWFRIAPWQPIVWLPGMSVRIGSRILRLEAVGQRPTVWNEPITVRTAKPANNQRAATPPSSALTVRINRADKCGHAMATSHPATHNGAARTRRSAMRELFSEVEIISATVQSTASAAPRKTGPVAATSGRYGA
jgi:pSer/pThr/pTyr-binding forkhead associated (FHA) protein